MGVSWDYISWELSYTYTHPEMYTMYPKQGKRVGVIGATVTAEGVTQAVRNQLLPTGTSLYIIEEDYTHTRLGWLWRTTKDVTSRRCVSPCRPPLAITLDKAQSINITNHSMEDATSHIPSLIAEHGRFVFTHPRNYRDLVEMTEESFVKWSDSNGTEYWDNGRQKLIT